MCFNCALYCVVSEYNELKSELSDFLKGFAQQGKVSLCPLCVCVCEDKCIFATMDCTHAVSLPQPLQVVSKRDIDDFFEEMQARKRRRVDLGEGLPPKNCHY